MKSVLSGLLFWCCLLLCILPAHASRPAQVVALDWTLTETLLALGVTPIGIAQADGYQNWVGVPSLPVEVIDLGLRSQPNLELMASLQPQRILVSPLFKNMLPRLSRIAPVETLELFAPHVDTWQQVLAYTRKLAQLVDRAEAGEELIAHTQNRLLQLRGQLASQARNSQQKAVLLVQLMDDRHVRVFGQHGLYHAVLAQLGLENAWQGTTNYWGFSLVGMEALADVDAHLVVVEPYPAGVKKRLSTNGLWQHLPAVRQGNVSELPAVWSFGALPAAGRFAELLVAALQGRHRQEVSHAH